MSRRRSRAKAYSMLALYMVGASVIFGDIVFKAVGTADWSAWTAALVLGPLLAVAVLVVTVALLLR